MKRPTVLVDLELTKQETLFIQEECKQKFLNNSVSYLNEEETSLLFGKLVRNETKFTLKEVYIFYHLNYEKNFPKHSFVNESLQGKLAKLMLDNNYDYKPLKNQILKG